METNTARVFNGDNLRGKVHSVFEHAINFYFELEDGGRLYTILPPESPGLPDSVTVSCALFSRLSALKPGTAVWKRQNRFLVEENGFVFTGRPASYPESPVRRDISPQRAKLFFMQWEEFRALSGRSSGFEAFSPQSQKELKNVLVNLYSALQSRTEYGFLEELGRYIGLGKGLTPSFDDALVGVMCFSSVRLPDSAPPFFGGRKKFGGFLADKTTEVSRKYLCCACEGRYSEKLVELINAISGESCLDLKPYLNNTAETGATSGMDTLWGLAAVCEAAAKKQEARYGPLF